MRRYIERDALPGFLEAQRWSGSTRGALKAARFTDWGVLRAGTQPVFLTLIEAERADGRREQYLLPLATVTGADAERIAKTAPGQVLARITGARKGLLVDAVVDDRACDLLLEAFASSRELAGQHGTIRGGAHARPGSRTTRRPCTRSARSATERPNSSVAYGTRKHLKLLRRLDAGLNPEIEIGSYLDASRLHPRPAARGLAGVPVRRRRPRAARPAAGSRAQRGRNVGADARRARAVLRARHRRRGAAAASTSPTGSLVSLAQAEPPEPVIGGCRRAVDGGSRARPPHGGDAPGARAGDGRSRVCARTDRRRGREER